MIKAAEFALFGAKPLFVEPKPTPNLYQPDIQTFLNYSRVFYRNKRYTNDGELCRLLESRLADFHEVEHAILTVSGFWALVLSIGTLALPGRSEVVTPSINYRRIDDCIAWAGFTPHFCDVEPVTLSITVETIRSALNERTALIVAPHPMVNCCDAAAIEAFAETYGIPVIFDSVESVYKVCDGKRIGGFGDAEIFSMHASKLINAFEGGYITTRHQQLAKKLSEMKRFGLVDVDKINEGQALNAKLNEMHAAMALASLDGIEAQVNANRKKYQRYFDGLNGISGLELLPHSEVERSDFRVIVVRITDGWPLNRNQTLRLLQSENIAARPYYDPLHKKTVPYKTASSELPVTKEVSESLFVLPSGAHCSEADVSKITDFLQTISLTGPQLRSQFGA